jgi:glycosyltransferase involved in cell wall biosynthesis
MKIRTSVIIPVRNGSHFLAEAIESATLQLNETDEIVVVWDNSDDDTKSIAMSLKDPRIRAIKGPELGVSGGRNAGLAAALGEFVAFLDHDDLWPAGRHIKLMQVLVENPHVGAVFGRMRIRLDPGATPWEWILNLDGRHVPGPNLGTGLFRTSILRKLDGFDTSLRFGEDIDYFLRLEELGMKFALCEVEGLIYRRHATNCTNNLDAVQQSVFDVIKRRMARAASAKERK